MLKAFWGVSSFRLVNSYRTIRTTRLKTRARTRSPVSGAMSLPNCTNVLRNRFILPRVRPLLLVPCRCESKSDSDKAADGGSGGLRLPVIGIKVHLLLIAKRSLTQNYFVEDIFIVSRFSDSFTSCQFFSALFTFTSHL